MTSALAWLRLVLQCMCTTRWHSQHAGEEGFLKRSLVMFKRRSLSDYSTLCRLGHGAQLRAADTPLEAVRGCVVEHHLVLAERAVVVRKRRHGPEWVTRVAVFAADL